MIDYSDYDNWVCGTCKLSNLQKPGVDVQYSFGYYAGRYHEGECWRRSGYRDAVDASAEFDETYAGESLHGDDGDPYEPEY